MLDPSSPGLLDFCSPSWIGFFWPLTTSNIADRLRAHVQLAIEAPGVTLQHSSRGTTGSLGLQPMRSLAL